MNEFYAFIDDTISYYDKLEKFWILLIIIVGFGILFWQERADREAEKDLKHEDLTNILDSVK